MKREIKFRCLNIDVNGRKSQEWIYFGIMSQPHIIGGYYNDDTLGQFTGRLDKNGKEIYEGDIFRIEEDGDYVDIMIYVVIVWVSEWCMFAALRVEDEYHDYLNEGVKALDEPMFWTYTLEDTNSRKHYLCGNIYENPELLK